MLALLLGVFSIGFAVAGSPLWLFLGGQRSQLERDQLIAQFLAEASAAEKTIVEQPEWPETYRSTPAMPDGELLPWYRRVTSRLRSS